MFNGVPMSSDMLDEAVEEKAIAQQNQPEEKKKVTVNLADSEKTLIEYPISIIKKDTSSISELRNASDMRTDVQSKVDEELGYLNKESRYFIRKRLIEPTSEETIEMESYNYNDLF